MLSKKVEKSQKDKLINEIFKILDTGKSRIIKKYNLSHFDIKELIDILNGKTNTFLQENIKRLLTDYSFNVKECGIGYEVF